MMFLPLEAQIIRTLFTWNQRLLNILKIGSPKDELASYGETLKTMPPTSINIQTPYPSQEELTEMKRINPSGCLKMMMSIQSSLIKKCSSSSIISGGEPCVKTIYKVFRQLKLKILGKDLFRTLNDDFMFSFRIKALLKKLKTSSAPKAIVGFIVEFNPLLDQIIIDIQRKNEAMGKLKPKEDVQSQEWVLVTPQI